jgi:hypothetical protein
MSGLVEGVIFGGGSDIWPGRGGDLWWWNQGDMYNIM